VQASVLETYRRNLQRALESSAGDFLNFDAHRQMGWGYEVRRPDSNYYWDGMRRGASPKQPRLLFQFTLNGRGEYAEGEKLWSVEPGYGFTVIVPSAHRYCLPENSSSWTFFWIMVRHPFVTERIQSLRREEAAVQRWEPGSPALESAMALFDAACHGKLRDVWSFEKLLFSWLLDSESELHRRRFPQDERQRLLDETRAIVCKRLHQPLSVEELADLHQLERTTFSRKFKTKTGISPAAWMTEVRLDESLKLLRTRAKLEDIAAETGFADANHFCKVFRRHFHSSPGAYRRLILK
jgi:AraC-like DNA-binding protein